MPKIETSQTRWAMVTVTARARTEDEANALIEQALEPYRDGGQVLLVGQLGPGGPRLEVRLSAMTSEDANG